MSDYSNILVVEDNNINQILILKILKKLGFNPDLAENGKEAVEKTHEKSYDLIFMDIQMPIMDGITATKEIRKFNDNAKIIALTAYDLPENKRECLAAGMNKFVGKPITLSKMKNVLSEI